jgi:uncharacterized RDD family membrane protein YckC
MPICMVHYTRFGYVRPARAIVFYSLLFYGLCAIFWVSLPLPIITPDVCEVHTLARQMRLTPFQFVPDIVQANHITLRHLNLISILESPVFLQACFNFLLRWSLGCDLRCYVRVGGQSALAIALTTTLAFELSQITGLFGLYPCPYRTFDVDDLLLNTTGALVGYGMMPFLAPYLPDLQQRRAQPLLVSPFRRWVAFAIDWFMANSLARVLSALFLATGTAHPLWLDFGVYALWFVGVPYYWQGQTVGKALVRIRLVRSQGQPVQPRQLWSRYGVLIALPMLTEWGYHTWTQRQLVTQGYVGGWLAIALLGGFCLEALALVGVMLVRPDHRGLHDLVANTDQRVIRPYT